MTPKAFRFVVLLAAALLANTVLLAAENTTKLPRIAALTPGDVDRWNNAFYEGLRENGYVDGSTAIVDWRVTGGNFELGRKLAGELIALHPDVIFVAPGALAKFVVNVSRNEIPIVVLTWDPVAEGLVDSAARPGGKITGVAGVWHTPTFMTKHLQLMKDLVPELSRVVFVMDTVWYREDELLKTKEAMERGGQQMGVLVTSIGVQKPEQMEQTFAEAIRSKGNAIIVSASPMFASHRSLVIALAAKYRIPAVYGDELFAYDGGLMSYGTGVADMHRRAADIVAKILRGAKAADIPVDYPTRFRLVVNLRTAKTLGLAIPGSVLLQADEVIK